MTAQPLGENQEVLSTAFPPYTDSGACNSSAHHKVHRPQLGSSSGLAAVPVQVRLRRGIFGRPLAVLGAVQQKFHTEALEDRTWRSCCNASQITIASCYEARTSVSAQFAAYLRSAGSAASRAGSASES